MYIDVKARYHIQLQNKAIGKKEQAYLVEFDGNEYNSRKASFQWLVIKSRPKGNPSS
jgi:hypothetical protein